MRREYYLYMALLLAWISTLGSLFFGEVLKYPPCVLCWYQRIAMYPLVVIFMVGIWKKTPDLHWFVLPLAIPGALIALYQNLLYYGILPESRATCQFGVSCTTKYIELLGFISIPMLSLLAFLAIIVGMFLYRRKPQG